MKQSVVKSEAEVVLVPALGTEELVESAKHLPSYRPTPWALVNRVLDVVDSVSGGRAGWVQRFFSFAFFGGLAALVNLTVFYIGFYIVPLPFSVGSASSDAIVHNILAYLIACEISLMANFIPNDYFTFSQLHDGTGRSWGARCLRYHLTSITGSVLTFIIQIGFTALLHITPIIGQAAALIIVLFYNFAFHHLFTYRHKKVTVEEAIVEVVREAVTGEIPVTDPVRTAL